MTTPIPLHPLCELFPAMDEAEYEVLKADIAANTLIEPIVLLDGKVLDGRNRMRACVELGIELQTIEYEGDDPASFVRSRNFARRHLTKAQQAVLVALFQDWNLAHAQGRPKQGTDKGATLHLSKVDDRAAAAGVSTRTQKKADRVAKKAPEIAKQVAAGEMSLDAATAKVDGKPEPASKPAPVVDESPVIENDLLADLEDLRKRNLELEAAQAAIQADDPKAEVLKHVRLAEHARSEQAHAQEKVVQANKARDFYLGQLRRCGKAVGEKDIDKIAPAVEAMARAKKAA